jgi:Ketopantoate reductase PanE/ApbA
MKILILGAGVLGSILGGHLARAGEAVTIIARGRRAEYLEQHGITFTGLADFTVPVTVTTKPQTVPEADILVVAVKTYDTDPALASVRHLRVGSVLSIQNGVLKDEQLANTFGWDKTVGAAAFLSGSLTPAGPVRFTVNEYLTLGELSGGTSARVQTLVTTLVKAGIRAEAVPQIQAVEWSKYALFMSWMAPAVLTRLESYKVSDPTRHGVDHGKARAGDRPISCETRRCTRGSRAAAHQNLVHCATLRGGDQDPPVWDNDGGAGAGAQGVHPTGSRTRPASRSRGDPGVCRTKGRRAGDPASYHGDLLQAHRRHQPIRPVR